MQATTHNLFLNVYFIEIYNLLVHKDTSLIDNDCISSYLQGVCFLVKLKFKKKSWIMTHNIKFGFGILQGFKDLFPICFTKLFYYYFLITYETTDVMWKCDIYYLL